MEKVLTLFIGDPFLTDELLKERLTALEKDHPGGLFKQSFRLKETPLQEILGLARTLPFLVTLQVFRIADADLLKEDDLRALDLYVQAPGPRTHLYLQSQNTELKKNPLKTWAEKRKLEVVFFSEREKQGSVSRFIRDKLRSSGKKIASDAQKMLEEQAGGHPGLVDSMLNQLIRYAGDRAEISADMVALFEEKMTTVDIYQLVDAITSGRTPAALRLFNNYMEENDSELMAFIGLLHWQLRRYWLAACLLEQGVSESSILFRCGVREYQARNFMRQVRQLSRMRLEKAIEGLFQTDWALKTGKYPDERMAFENWLIAGSA